MISLIKRLTTYLLLFVLIFWISRIISINGNKQEIIEFRIGDKINCGDVIICPSESHLYASDEFCLEVLDRITDNDDYVLTVCFIVTNNSDSDIYTDAILSFLDVGFESDLWCSSVDPEYYRYQNEHLPNTILPGESQKIWLSTNVSKICFKDSTWKSIEEEDFFYVLHLAPNKIVVRLDI